MMPAPQLRKLIAELDERLTASERMSTVGVKLPFNGTLSADEQRMLEQHAFDA